MVEQKILKLEDGVEYKIDGNMVVFRVYLDKSVGVSKSGKMEFNCNTHGWANISNGVKANIMIGTSIEPKDKKPKKPVKKLSM